MKRILIIGYATALLFAPFARAQEGTPAPPPVEPQVPAEHPGMSRSTPPSQAVVPVPVPMAPPKPNGPVQKSLVRITATAVDPDYKAPWNAGGLQRGVGAGFVISGNRIMTNAHVVANSRYITVERDGDPNKYPAQVQFIANDCDLALITVPAKDFFKNMVPLKFGGIPALESTVSAYGYPIGGERMSVTTGIVSRVDFQLYTHSSVDQHLAIQISAQINPGNSGGPVMQDGKVVGVAFQGYSGDVAQGVAYMIPTPVINRFLKDISNGQYDEYPDLAITYAKLQNPAQRKFLGLKDDDRGVLVGSVVAAGPSDGILKSGDVLLSIDGHPIASDANVELDGERSQFEEVVEHKFKGDSVKLDILRDKQPMTVTIKLFKPWPYSIQGHSYDVRPRYVLYGGLLFQPLNLDMLEAYRTSDLRLRHFFEYFILEQIYLDHPDVIVLSNILPDPINSYLAPYRGGIVDEVNGKKIRTLDELSEAFAQAPERLVIRMIGDGPPLVLDRNKVEAARERIKTRYNVLKEQNLEESPRRASQPQRIKTKMRRHSFITFSIVLVAVSGALAKKEPAIPTTATKPKQVALVRVNVTGQGYDYFRPWQKKAPVFKARARSGFAERSRSCHCRLGYKPKLRRARARRVGRKNGSQCPCNRLRSEPGAARTGGEKFPRRHHAARNHVRHSRWRPARGLATGTDRRVAGDRRSGDNGANDALPDRCWEFPHVPRQHSNAVSREQLHGSAGQEQQARRIAAALRFALTTARCYPGAGHHAFLKGSRRSELSWFPIGRLLIFSDAGSRAARVRG